MADYNLGRATGEIKLTYDDSGVERARNSLGQFVGGPGGGGAGGKGSIMSANAAMNQMAMTAGIAGAAVGAGLALAGKVAISFEKQISAIAAVSGATGSELEALRKKALQLGADTAFSASEAGLAMEELVKAGLPVAAVLNGAADATVALAAAGGVSLPEAATIAANAMNTFALSAKDLGHVADIIAGAANASAIDVSQFGLSMSQAGAVAHLVGLSFDDMAVAIALLGNAGIKGSDAGTSLKTMLSNLQPVTKRQIGLFHELGLLTKDGANQFFDATGKVKSLAEISGVLQNVTKGMTQQQKALTLEMIFGSDAIRAAAVLTEQGSKGFNDMATAMGKVSAQDVAKTRLDNVAGALEQLKGSAETAAIVLGTTMLPAIKALAGFLKFVADGFSSLGPGVQQTIVILAAVAGTILLVVAAFIKIMQFIKAFQIAWAALNITFAISPIGLIIIAIVALIAVIVLIATKTTWFQQIWAHVWDFMKTVGAWFAGPFAGFFVDAWNKISKAFGSVIDFFKGIGAWFAGPFANFFKDAWNAIQTAFQAAINFIMPVVNVFIAAIQGFVGIWVKVWQTIAPAVKAAFDLVVSIISLAWSIISAIFAVIRTVTTALFGFIYDFVAARMQAMWDLVVFIWGKISAATEFAWNIIKGVILAFFNWLAPYVQAAWDVVVGVFTAIGNAISTAAQATWNAIKFVITGVFEFLKPYIETAINAIMIVIQTVWDAISATTSVVWNVIKTVIGAVWDAIMVIVRTAVATIAAIFNGFKAIIDNVKGFFDGLKKAADGGVGELLAFVGAIPGKIIAAIGNLAGLLWGKGVDLVQGLINGIKSMFGAVGRVAGDLVRKITDFLPGSPAKKGPLSGKGYTLLRGQRAAEDFASGFQDNAPSAAQAAASMVSNMAAALPGDAAGAVTSAVSQATTVGATAAPAAPVTQGTTTQPAGIIINTLALKGVWDFTDPGATRKMIAQLRAELDKYEKEYA